MNNYAGQSRRSAVNVLVDQLKHEKTTLDQVGSDERPLLFFDSDKSNQKCSLLV